MLGADERSNPRFQFLGGLVGKRGGDNLQGRTAAIAQVIQVTLRQNKGFAGSGSGSDGDATGSEGGSGLLRG
jgi:hypothetical protein